MPDLAKQRDFFICATCGTQFRETAGAPQNCPICLDERQYVGPERTGLDHPCPYATQGFKNVFRELEPGVVSITTEPKFGIGQRAFLPPHSGARRTVANVGGRNERLTSSPSHSLQ